MHQNGAVYNRINIDANASVKATTTLDTLENWTPDSSSHGHSKANKIR
jgi:hypothetical protein